MAVAMALAVAVLEGRAMNSGLQARISGLVGLRGEATDGVLYGPDPLFPGLKNSSPRGRIPQSP